MPQHFKFVFLLFDCNVEKLQVRPLDIRLLKIYSSNKPSDEACTFVSDKIKIKKYIFIINKIMKKHFSIKDFEHKNISNVFQKLEENCLYACAYFRAEYGLNHFRHLLVIKKNYYNKNIKNIIISVKF